MARCKGGFGKVIIAIGVNGDGWREVLGMDIGRSEAQPFWTEFLRKLTRRGLRGVKLVISDAHEGLKAAATKILGASWQRCRVHSAMQVHCRDMHNALAHANKNGRRVVSAFIATAFAAQCNCIVATGQCARRQQAMAPCRRPAAVQFAQARQADG